VLDTLSDGENIFFGDVTVIYGKMYKFNKIKGLVFFTGPQGMFQ